MHIGQGERYLGPKSQLGCYQSHLPTAPITSVVAPVRQVPEREATAVREAGGKLSPQLGKRLYEDGDQETRSVRTLLLLVLLHTVCWAPFYVVYSLNAHVSARIVPYNIVEIV